METTAPPVENAPQSLSRLRALLADGEANRLSNPKQAFTAAEQALALALQLGDDLLLAQAERLFARVVGDLGRHHEGLKYALSAVRRFEDLRSERDLALALTVTGLAYGTLCDYDDALATFERAERIALRLNDDDLELRVIGNMGLVYSDIKNFVRARDLLERTLALAQKLGHQDLMLRSQCNLGHIDLEHGRDHLEAQRYDAARERFEYARNTMTQVLDSSQVHLSPFDKAMTQLNLGSIHLELGELDLAQRYLSVAKHGLGAVGDLTGAHEADLCLAMLKARRGDVPAAISALREFACSDDPGITQLMRSRAWRDLSRVCEQAGDFAMALDAFKHFHALDRTLMNERVSNRAVALALKMDMERAQIEADVLRIHAEQLMDKNTQLADEADVLSRQAHEDGLTSLSNRRHFDEQFPKLLEQARASGSEMYVAMADLDHFKQVNDRFSHSVGDEVLRQVSAILRAQSRADDLVARYGGEEFILVLQHANAQQALTACQRLRSAVEHRNWPALADGLAVTMSIGVARCDPDQPPLASIEAADQLLYRAKEQGRNQVCM
jgi:diguanylate cyclase (GGDEF)-like protein